MAVKKSFLDTWRVKIFRSLTRNIGMASRRHPVGISETGVKSILVIRPNHRLGNQLLLTPLIADIARMFPESKVDLLVKGPLGPVLFRNFTNVDKLIMLPRRPFSSLLKYARGWMQLRRKRYDMAVNAVYDSSSGRLATPFANARFKFYGDIDDRIKTGYADWQHMAKFPVYTFRLALGKSDRIPVPKMDLKLSRDELADGKNKLMELVGNGRETICLYTFATGNKCHPKSWWEPFYASMKSEFPGYNIVEILPVENVSQISFQAPAFYSRDIREIGSIVAACAMFVGTDSGMMHVAASVDVITIGLFSASNIQVYAPYGGLNTGINTERTSIEECVKLTRRTLDARDTAGNTPGQLPRQGFATP